MTVNRSSFRPRRLPSRAAPFLLPLILTMIMTLIVSGISTLRGIGLGPDFLGIWMQAWGLSWMVAYPVILFVLPLSRRIVAGVVEPPPGQSPG